MAQNALRVRTFCTAACLALGLIACGEDVTTQPTGRVGLSILPLELEPIERAVYDIKVEYLDENDVWQENLVIDDRGSDFKGSLSYVGPCVAGDADESRVTVTLLSVFDANDDPVNIVLPPPSVTNFTCIENADTEVIVDIYVLLSASQGFFDVSISFEDYFCSAKVDCQPELLQDKTTGERGPTLVTGMVCTGDGNADLEDTYINFTDAYFCCDDGVTALCSALEQEPGFPGIQYSQLYTGTETVAGSHFINTAWRLDMDYFSSHAATCTFSAFGYVNYDPNGNPSTEYQEGLPAIHFFGAVDTQGACLEETGIYPNYSADPTDPTKLADCHPDPDIGPREPERCNGIDDNCNDEIDEGLADCAPPDEDADNVADAADNCPGAFNPAQGDIDFDGVGDACDSDKDGDGILNASDNCPAIANPGQEDANRNGVGDICETGGSICGDGTLQAPEVCDAGDGNSDTVPDACRTNCLEASCGDGVQDTGEQCDDGNTISGDGCEPDCTSNAVLGQPIPYEQGFDSAESIDGAGWYTPAIGGWTLASAGPLGPDPHPRFLYDSSAVNFEAPLLSPVFDASAAPIVTFQSQILVEPNGSGGSVTLDVQVSNDAGQSWATLYSAGTDEALAETLLTLDVSSQLGSQPDAQVRYLISGATGTDVLYIEMDDMVIAPGRPPSLTNVPDISVESDSTQFLSVSASDPDTPAANLVFSFEGPDFITVNDNNNGSATLVFEPLEEDVGTYEAVIRVTDGVFRDERRFLVLVSAPTGGGVNPISIVLVRDAPGGGGDPVGDLTLVEGETTTFFAAGYDIQLNYLNDVNVLWRTTGSLPSDLVGPLTSYIFNAELAGTVGTVVADHADPGVVDDETGTITVIAGEGGPPPPDVNTSFVTALPDAMLADGTDTATITVTLRDEQDRPVTAPHTVQILTTAGTLLGSVDGSAGDGTYTQLLQASTVNETATITATVDTDPIIDDATVRFATAEYPIQGGTSIIDCANYPTFQDKDLVVSAGTLYIDTAGCAPMSFGIITIEPSGILSHSDSTTTETQSLELLLDGLRIKPLGRIDVSGAGYRGSTSNGTPGHTLGNQTVGGAQSRGGGSYGGYGGYGVTAPRGTVYGDFRDPREPGAGGGYYSGRGEDGGGLVRITIRPNGIALIDGEIRANGELVTTNGGGGAGGGIFLSTPALFGEGTISANGGASQNGNSGGGGGGRIAIVDLLSVGDNFVSANLTDAVTAYGGYGQPNVNAGAGSIYVEYPGDGTAGRLYFDNGGEPSEAGSTPLLSGLMGGIVDGQTNDSITDIDGGFITDQFIGTLVAPKYPQGLDGLADDVLFRVTANDVDTLTLDGDPTGVGTTPGVDVYRGITRVQYLIVTGNARVDAGDGAVWVTSGTPGDSLRYLLEGELNVDVLDLGPVSTIDVRAGGHLIVNDAIVGSDSAEYAFDLALADGTLSVPGDYLFDSVTATGGSALNVPGTLTVQQSAVFNASALDAGTVLISGDLIASGGTIDAGTIDVTGDTTFSNGVVVTIENPSTLIVGGDLIARDAGTILTHAPMTTDDVVKKLRIEANNVHIEAGATIDVDARGYRGGYSATPYQTAGHAPNDALEAAISTGGGHGGQGNRSAGSTDSGDVFDSIWAPRFPGGGGGAFGSSTSYRGGHGGGLVEFIVIDTFTLDGTISADGESGQGRLSGGGAGGGIYVQAGTIAGTGSVSARGGQGDTGYGGGGGGGRAAFVATVALGGGFGGATPWDFVDLRGGVGWAQGTYGTGGAGTFFRREADADGDLIIDNGGVRAADGSTPLPFEGSGTTSALSPQSLTDNSGATDFTTRGSLVDYRVVPTLDHGDVTLADELSYVIATNTVETLTIQFGDMTNGGAVSAGATWSAFYHFDNLELRGGANLAADALIRVDEGDVGTGDATTFVIGGDLDVRTLDLAGVTTLVTPIGQGVTVSANTFIQGNSLDYPFIVELNDAVWNQDVMAFGAITSTGASQLNGGILNLQAPVFMTGATVTVDTVTAPLGVNVVMSGGTWNVGQIDAPANVTIQQAADITVFDDLVRAGGNLSVVDADTRIRPVAMIADDVIKTLQIEAIDVTIGADAALDASNRGYVGGYSGHTSTTGHAPLPQLQSHLRVGGSHGGLSHVGNSGQQVGNVYDSLYWPRLPGAGGGAYTSGTSYRGGHGGGVIAINATGIVTNNGTIAANGESGAPYLSGGGAGGSIAVDAATVAGTGVFEATGGPGQDSYSASGGGGRIAILASDAINGVLGSNAPWSLLDASGSTGFGVPTGAGTIFRRVGASNGDLIIDNKDQNAAADSTPLPFQGQGTSSGLTATGLSDAFADFTPNGSLLDYLLNPNQDQGNTTLTDDVAFALSENQETLLTIGAGDMTTVANEGDSWSAFYVFDNLEIRGQAKVEADVQLLVLAGDVKSGDATTFGLAGQLNVRLLDLNLANTIAMATGVGAGLTVTQDLIRGDLLNYPFVVDLQDGFIVKDNISVSTLVTNGGSISGTTLEIAGTFNAGTATITFDHLTAPAGTNMDLVGGTWFLGDIIAPGDVTMRSGADVQLRSNTFNVGGTLTLSDSGTTLTHVGMSNDDAIKKLEIRAAALSLGADTLIDVRGKGYLGGYAVGSDGATNADTRGRAPADTLRSLRRTGGSHGGLGRRGNTNEVEGKVYDSLYRPSFPGAGGGAYTSGTGSRGGNGGGYVDIVVDGAALLNGDILADGENGSSYSAAGGAGGSILVDADSISGTGTLSADGGNGNTNYSGSGGGGRIALRAAMAITGPLGGVTPWTNVSAHSADGYSSFEGGAGTIYRKVGAALGDLIVDNGGVSSVAGGTPMPFQGTRPWTGLTATTLTDAFTDFTPNGDLADYMVVPEIGYGTPTLADDRAFRIVANGEQTLTVDGGDMTDGGALTEGDYSAYYAFDNLEIRGLARVKADALFYVASGDLANDDAQTFAIGGDFDVRTLDLGTVTDLAMTVGSDATLQVGELLRGNDASFAFNANLQDGNLIKSDLSLADVLATAGAVIDADTLRLDGVVSTAGGTVTADLVTTIGAANLNIGGGTWTVGQIVTPNAATLGDAIDLTLTQDLIQAGGVLTLEDVGTIVRQVAMVDQTVRKIRLEAASVAIGADVVVNASGLGYRGAYQLGHITTSGDAPPGVDPSGARNGGAHGGMPHPYSGIPAGDAYDSFVRPRLPGGGGGTYTASYPGGSGGGVIEVVSSGAVHVDGSLRVNGAGTAGRGAGGAGGSIYIEGDTVAGNADLQARGGVGHTSYATGGAGGRIAVIGLSAINGPLGGITPWTQFAIEGADGWSAPEAGSGTFFRRVGAANGDLIVDNAGIDSDDGSTPLLFEGTGTSTNLAANSLTDTFVDFFSRGSLQDYQIVPNVVSGTATLCDDEAFTIASSTTPTVITTGADMTINASEGDTWSAYYKLDNLEVRGKAKMSADALVCVLEGDVKSGDAITFELGGELDVRSLDLNASTTIAMTNGVGAGLSVSDQLLRGDNAAYPFTVNLQDGYIVKDDITVGTLVTNGGSISGTTLTVSGTFNAGTANLDFDVLQNQGGANIDLVGGNWSLGTISGSANVTLRGGADVLVEQAAISVGGTLSVIDAGTVLRHPATGSDGVVHKLSITTTDMVLGVGAAIDVAERGYRGASQAGQAAYIGQAPPGIASPNNGSGGAHGGLPQTYSNTNIGSVYGAFARASDAGGGGGSYHPSYPGGNGGGFVEVQATGAVTLDGDIRARGMNSPSRGAGGAGGGIHVQADTISGTGHIDASGGSGHTSYSTGGGGGRISLIASSAITGGFGGNTPWTQFRVDGGSGWSSPESGSGTFYRRAGATDGDLIIDNQDTLTFEGSTPLTFQGAGQITGLEPLTLTDGNAINTKAFDAWGSLAGYFVNPKTGQGTVSLGDDTVFPIVSNTSVDLVTAAGRDFTSVAAVGDFWSAYYRFDNLEIRGGARLEADAEVRVDDGDVATADTLTFKIAGSANVRALDLGQAERITLASGVSAKLEVGTIVRDSDPTFPFDVNLGDGTIVANIFALGTLTANGGTLRPAEVPGSILYLTQSVTATNANFSDYETIITLGGDDLSITGGTWDVDELVTDGNLVITDADVTATLISAGLSVTISGANAQVTTNSLTSGLDLTLSGGGTLISDGVDVVGALTMTDLGTTLGLNDMLNDGVGGILTVNAGSLSLGTGATIDVSERGYLGGYHQDNSDYRGQAPVGAGRAGGYTGGSHGGLARDYSTATIYQTNEIYGLLTRPTTPGAGGGAWGNSASYPGGDGGGAVLLLITGDATLDGTIEADGGYAPINGRGAGGAGGSVLVDADTIGGTGSISARGSNAHTSYSTAGGGGRVALLAQTAITGVMGGSSPFDAFNLGGGDGYLSPDAGAGTLFRRVGTAHGDLIVDNKDRSAFVGSTPLPFQGSGTTSDLTTTGGATPTSTMTDSAAAFGPVHALAGYRVSPDFAQGGGNLADDVSFAIISDTDTTLTVDGDMTAVAGAGDTWSAYYQLDNLEVRGRASVAADAQVRVEQGDLASDDATTFEVGGVLVIRELDLPTVNQLRFTQGQAAQLQVEILRRGDDAGHDWNLDLHDGGVYSDVLALGALTADNVAGRIEPLTTGPSTLTLTDPIVIEAITISGWDLVTAPTGQGISVAGGTWSIDAFDADGDIHLSEVSKVDDGAGGLINSNIHTVITTDSITSGATLRVDGGAEVAAAALNAATAVLVEADAFGVGTTVVRQTPMADETVAKLTVTAPVIDVGVGAHISADEAGFRGGYQPGNSRVQGDAPPGVAEANYNTGGSHGGIAFGYSSYVPGDAYGSLFRPTLPGAGGGCYNGSYPGGNGGGLVELNASTLVTIDGAVSANGGDRAGSRGGGGAGGALVITAPTIAGTGTLEAHGGDAHTSYSTGGSGGRIALLAAASITGPLGGADPWDHFNVGGGSGWSSPESGAGTFFRRVGSADGDLMIDNEGVNSLTGSTPLIFQGQGLVTSLTATALTDSTANFLSVESLTDYRVNPRVGQNTASLGDDVVFTIADATEFELTVASGDLTTVAAENDTWSAYYRFDNLEVRGRARMVADAQVRVDHGDVSGNDTTSFQLGGTLDVRVLDLDGVDLIALTSGVGARLEVDTLQRGANYVYPFDFNLADGDVFIDTLAIGTVMATTGEFHGGAGASSTLVVHAPIGVSGAVFDGYREVRSPAGTALTITGGTWKNLTTVFSDLDLAITGGNVTAERIQSVTGNVNLSGGAKVTAEEVTAVGTVTLSDAGTELDHPDINTNDGPELRTLTVSATNVVIGAGAAIDVSDRGYRGGQTVGNSDYRGQGPPGVDRGYYRNGGGHGGVSANYNAQPGKPAYGSLYRPSLPGAGGNRSDSSGSYLGGHGGGLAELLVSGTVTINGTLAANGETPNNGGVGGGGGAGGGLYVEADVIDGAGVIEAKGGLAHTSYGQGGGGGRVSLVAQSAINGVFGSNSPWTNVDLRGGTGWSTDSGAGTFYRRVGTTNWGDLLIDNKDVPTFAGSTPLPWQGSGVISALTALTLQSNAVDFEFNGDLAGYLLNPAIGQGDRNLADDVVFSIASAVDDVLTVAAGDMTVVSDTSQTWSAYYRFDNLEIRDGARVVADAQLRIESGDIGSGDATTFSLGGGLDVRDIDLAQVGLLRLTSGEGARLTVDTLRHADLEAFPYDLDLNDGIVDIDRLTLRFLTSDGGQILPITQAGSVLVLTEPLNVPDVVVGTFGLLTTPVGGALELRGGTWRAEAVTAGTTITLADTVIVESDEIQAGTNAVISGGAQVQTQGLRAPGDITVSDAGTVVSLVPMTGDDVITSLQVEAQNVTIGIGAQLDAGDAGYLGGSESGNPDIYGRAPAGLSRSGYHAGGSHGGRASDNYSSGVAYASGAVYDSLYRPRYPGAGGGRSANGHTGQSGGGLIEIVATGTVTIDGEVSANGHGGTTSGPGGAGGGIFVGADVIGGAGLVEARGGLGHNSYGSGGGGGRIALHAETSITGVLGGANPFDHIDVSGDTGYNTDAGAGTFYRRVGSALGDLIVDNKGIATFSASTPLVFQGQGESTDLTATTLADSATAPLNFTVFGDLQDYRLNPKSGQGAVNLGDDTVFTLIQAIDARTLQIDAMGGAGMLAPGGPAEVGDTWSAYYAFDNLEVRGGARVQADAEVRVNSGDVSTNNATTFGLSGELAVRDLDLNGVTTLRLDTSGDLDAETLIRGDAVDYPFNLVLNGGTYDVSKLSFGSITGDGNIITGAGDLTATSINGNDLALNVDSVTVTNDVSVTGNSAWTADAVTVGGDLDIDISTVWTVQTVDVTGAFSLLGTSQLRHAETHGADIYRLQINASDATIASGTLIDVSGRGWRGGTNSGFLAQGWPDGSDANAPYSRNGGCHGGLGGQYVAGPDGCHPYGRIDDAYFPGSGGAFYATGSGGHGGGVIRISAPTGTVTVDGTLKANGTKSVNNSGGGGAGGSIQLTGDVITGTGQLEVVGGTGGTSYASGGGGGGRIVISGYSTLGGVFLNDPWLKLLARGGDYSNRDGGAGTIFFRAAGDLYGTLIIDNGNYTGPTNGTPIPTVKTGTIDSIIAGSPDKLNDFSADFGTPDGLVQTMLRPDINDNGTLTLLDDVILVVTANLNTQLSMFGAAAVASAGNTYRGVVYLDQLEVRGNGKVYVESGDMIVLNGDVSNNVNGVPPSPSDGLYLEVQAGSEVTVDHQLEVDGIGQANITGTISANPLVCPDCP